ncbi:hypothetical protein HU200_035460 [Digitaria exilis]|uniref:Reverse transcriptase zinc-binding domain-containing protein n=1 Tax=Digitaria exilis TaxID=1010633 RepID=A0A835BHM1_9POAL|nr:hypothetical protein HU200_035460 [Digitaria exilis]
MVQFRGAYCTFDTNAIWGAMAEGKHRLFAWLLVQRKILTTSGGLVTEPTQGVEIEEWWNASMLGLPKELKRAKASIMIHTIWNVWKERNRRVFQGVATSPMRVLALIKDDLNYTSLALRREEFSLFS